MRAIDNLARAIFYRMAEDRAVRFYAQRVFQKAFKRDPSLDPATATFNDKLYWRKVFDRNPLFPRYLDKIEAKEIVRRVIGDEYITPTLWQGRDMRELAAFLRRQDRPYVVKCNHGAGWNIFVDDPGTAKIGRIVRKVEGWLRQVYGRRRGEPGYFRISPQAFVEPNLTTDGVLPVDYKFFVFDGIARCVEVDLDRATNHTQAFFDRNWTRQPFRRRPPAYLGEVPRPALLEEMIALAETIAAPFDFVRVDLYEIGGALRFGEVTLYPAGGTGPFVPDEYERAFGRMWNATPPPVGSIPCASEQRIER